MPQPHAHARPFCCFVKDTTVALHITITHVILVNGMRPQHMTADCCIAVMIATIGYDDCCVMP